MSARVWDAAEHAEPADGPVSRTVMRRGNTVERPAPPNVEALHSYLLALRAQGFEGVPTPIGPARSGREQLTFIPGDIAVAPIGEGSWAMKLDALASIGRLLRRLHDAAEAVPIVKSGEWPKALADPHADSAEKTVLCHNDINIGNVIFRGGRAAALIDFDMSAPGRPVWDVAVAARYWAILPRPSAAAARLRVLADSYELSEEGRSQLPAVLEQVFGVARSFIATRVADGDAQFVSLLATRGGWERWDRIQAWLTSQRAAFTAALLE